jgi:molecular chaperone GrpE (heat shock protein)
MKQRIIELRDDNEELQGKVKSLMLQIKMIHRKEDRFLEIYDIIHDRTRHGTEEMVKNKLNKMFNGLYG